MKEVKKDVQQIKHVTVGTLVNNFNTLNKGEQFIVLDEKYRGHVFTIQMINRPATGNDADRIVSAQYNGKCIKFTQQFLKQKGRKLIKSKIHEEK